MCKSITLIIIVNLIEISLGNGWEGNYKPQYPGGYEKPPYPGGYEKPPYHPYPTEPMSKTYRFLFDNNPRSLFRYPGSMPAPA